MVGLVFYFSGAFLAYAYFQWGWIALVPLSREELSLSSAGSCGHHVLSPAPISPTRHGKTWGSQANIPSYYLHVLRPGGSCGFNTVPCRHDGRRGCACMETDPGTCIFPWCCLSRSATGAVIVLSADGEHKDVCWFLSKQLFPLSFSSSLPAPPMPGTCLQCPGNGSAPGWAASWKRSHLCSEPRQWFSPALPRHGATYSKSLPGQLLW